jgi:hypothetical protein
MSLAPFARFVGPLPLVRPAKQRSGSEPAGAQVHVLKPTYSVNGALTLASLEIESAAPAGETPGSASLAEACCPDPAKPLIGDEGATNAAV